MPKYQIVYKDPDASIMTRVTDTDKWKDVNPHQDDFSDEEYEKLRRLGYSEYLCVEFDTFSMTSRVVAPKE